METADKKYTVIISDEATEMLFYTSDSKSTIIHLPLIF